MHTVDFQLYKNGLTANWHRPELSLSGTSKVDVMGTAVRATNAPLAEGNSEKYFPFLEPRAKIMVSGQAQSVIKETGGHRRTPAAGFPSKIRMSRTNHFHDQNLACNKYIYKLTNVFYCLNFISINYH
jgi:hypothetical protein